jgi:hypothetical protein
MEEDDDDETIGKKWKLVLRKSPEYKQLWNEEINPHVNAFHARIFPKRKRFISKHVWFVPGGSPGLFYYKLRPKRMSHTFEYGTRIVLQCPKTLISKRKEWIECKITYVQPGSIRYREQYRDIPTIFSTSCGICQLVPLRVFKRCPNQNEEEDDDDDSS